MATHSSILAWEIAWTKGLAHWNLVSFSLWGWGVRHVLVTEKIHTDTNSDLWISVGNGETEAFWRWWSSAQSYFKSITLNTEYSIKWKSGRKGPKKEKKKINPEIMDKLWGCQVWKVKLKVLAAQSCQTLYKSTDSSLPGSSVHGILKARILEWVATSFSRGFSWSRDWTWVSCIAGRFFTNWTTRETGLIMDLPSRVFVRNKWNSTWPISDQLQIRSSTNVFLKSSGLPWWSSD